LTPPAAGTYRVLARYSGDASYAPVATGCDDATERVVVTAEALPPQTTVTPGEGARILSASFASPPRVGATAVLVVRAFDPKQPISGMQVTFGEARGRAGVSSCRTASLNSADIADPVTLKLPYEFRTPGVHRVTIVVLSGDCTGKLTRTETTIEVTVGPAQSPRYTLRASRSGLIAGAAAAATCKDRFLVPTSVPATHKRVAAAVLCLVNAERRKLGRKKLRNAPRLGLAATAHSSDMLKRKYFEHERVPGGPKLKARLTKARYKGTTYAENIGYGSNYNATLMVRAWMNSPPHRANILHPRLRFGGVGISVGIPQTPTRPGSTYTMDFGRTLK
jgi:uncharacterized protein YkwD